MIVFGVWDFQVNHWMRFSAEIDPNISQYDVEVYYKLLWHAEVSFWLIRWVGNCDENSLEWRRSIGLSHPYRLNCRIFRSQSHSYTTLFTIPYPDVTLRRTRCPFMDKYLPLVFWLFAAPLNTRFNTLSVQNSSSNPTSMILLSTL